MTRSSQVARAPRVVFVAPFFLPATLRFVHAVVSLRGARVALITQDPLSRLPGAIRRGLAGHYQVADAMNAGHLAGAVEFLARKMGGVDRLFGPLEQLQVQLGQVRDHFRITGMGEQAAKNFRDKGRMKDVLRRGGLPCARHATVRSLGEAREFVARVGYPVVVKPPEGAGAVATYRASNDEELRKTLSANPPRRDRPVVVEEFLSGQENSLETVSINGQPVWDSHTRYLPAPLTVLENPWIQWTVLLPREENDRDTALIRQPARDGLAALGMHTGITHMEWFRLEPQGPDGAGPRPAISEVATRPPGAQIMSLNSYAHDVDFYQLWSRLMVFDTWPRLERKYATGAAYFRGQHFGRGERTGRVIALHGLDRAQREIGPLVVEADLPVIGRHKRSTYEGDGYAILRHPDTAVVEKALRRLVELVQVEVA